MRPDERPRVHLTISEQVAFIRIVAMETDRHARRLIDHWAQPGDVHPGQDRALDGTLRMMWRTPTDHPGE